MALQWSRVPRTAAVVPASLVACASWATVPATQASPAMTAPLYHAVSMTVPAKAHAAVTMCVSALVASWERTAASGPVIIPATMVYVLMANAVVPTAGLDQPVNGPYPAQPTAQDMAPAMPAWYVLLSSLRSVFPSELSHDSVNATLAGTVSPVAR